MVSTSSTSRADEPVVEERACERLETTAPDHALPPATLYIHLSREALETGAGVARMEDVGPITIGQASEFLRHSHVTIKPVIDLADDRPVDGYEVPTRLREQLHLRQPASAFPWSSATGRRMDADHTIPYGRGPTAITNLGKLTRFEHRVKTHAPGWSHRQPEPGVHEWRTPTGYQYTVDHDGTHARHVVSKGSTTRPVDSLIRHITSTTRCVDSAYERALVRLVARR